MTMRFFPYKPSLSVQSNGFGYFVLQYVPYSRYVRDLKKTTRISLIMHLERRLGHVHLCASRWLKVRSLNTISKAVTILLYRRY